MSIEQSQNISSIKEVTPNIVSRNVGWITNFKNRGILKFCNESGTKNRQMFISTVLNLIGIS